MVLESTMLTSRQQMYCDERNNTRNRQGLNARGSIRGEICYNVAHTIVPGADQATFEDTCTSTTQR